jgi:predicted anti-sigma-YlaC factor YlaD
MRYLQITAFSVVLALGTVGCSVKQLAVNSLADALSESGSVFASDNDPELIRQALPFSLKLIEALLAESPENRNLLLAASSGFTQYAYAFVQEDADRLELEDIAASDYQRMRARNLYLRARDYGLRGLALIEPTIASTLVSDPKGALAGMKQGDVPLLYWTAVSWAGAINVSRDQPELIAELPQVDALIDRALQLEPAYAGGSIYSFLIAYEFARAESEAVAIAKARDHFAKAVALSQGRLASPYVTLAESVCVSEQDRKAFVDLLEQALAVDPEGDIENRLLNTISQARARWLLQEIDELFWDNNDS